MIDPPFPEETGVKGDMLSTNKGYRKSESCFETPKSSEEHPEIGCFRSKVLWPEMGRDESVLEATSEITLQTWSNWDCVSCEQKRIDREKQGSSSL